MNAPDTTSRPKKQKRLGPEVIAEIARKFTPQIEQWLRTHAANEVEKAVAPLLARIRELELELEQCRKTTNLPTTTLSS